VEGPLSILYVCVCVWGVCMCVSLKCEVFFKLLVCKYASTYMDEIWTQGSSDVSLSEEGSIVEYGFGEFVAQ